MNILLIGSGGREHAMAKKINESPKCKNLFITPGNPGTASCGTNIALDITNDDDVTCDRKYRTYYGWPGTFLFDGDLRLKITDASFQDGVFIINRVIPAGKNEIDYQDYLARK